MRTPVERDVCASDREMAEARRCDVTQCPPSRRRECHVRPRRGNNSRDNDGNRREMREEMEVLRGVCKFGEPLGTHPIKGE